MILFTQILFWLAFLSILHTYVFYPLILGILSTLNKKKNVVYSSNYKPFVSVVFAAYNEESVIVEKINSIFNSNYSLDKITVFIGSDASTDQTDIIITHLKEKYENLKFERFETRTGKSGIINFLFKKCRAELVIGTDANIIFNKDTIPNFVRHFENKDISLVGGNIKYFKKNHSGISQPENTYLSFENRIKQSESDLWAKVQGVEGGLYCIRKEAFTPIPPLTFMEDFFITYSVFQKNGKVLFDQNIEGFEDVSTLQNEEFKRKTRISIGNFQNLNRFYSLLYKHAYPLGFAFLSHKILRWLTPFLGIITVISALYLHNQQFYSNYLYLVLSLALLTVIDWLLYQLKIKSGPLRYIGHFIMMNAALLNGFIKYLKGVRTNVWQPTKRNQ